MTGKEIAEKYGLEQKEFTPDNFDVGGYAVGARGSVVRIERWLKVEEGDDGVVMGAKCSAWKDDWEMEDIIPDENGKFSVQPEPLAKAVQADKHFKTLDGKPWKIEPEEEQDGDGPITMDIPEEEEIEEEETDEDEEVIPINEMEVPEEFV